VLDVADVVGAPSEGNYLTVFPAGMSPPLAADVNYTDGDLYTVVDNASYGTVGNSSSVGIYNGPAGGASTDVVVDEFGWFAPP